MPVTHCRKAGRMARPTRRELIFQAIEAQKLETDRSKRSQWRLVEIKLESPAKLVDVQPIRSVPT